MSAAKDFATRLDERIGALDNPSLLGLDPRLDYLPEHLQAKAEAADGSAPEKSAAAILDFNCEILEALKDIVPAVKFQSAYYEAYGAPGKECLRNSLKVAHQLGYLSIVDVKRNDISSTAEAYCRAILGQSELLGGERYTALGADALTLNGYLGSDGIEPFLKYCREAGKGCFILVRTSNPSAGELQDLILEDGRRVYEAMGDLVAHWGTAVPGKTFSSVGAVVGATWPRQAIALRQRMPQQIFLIPGYGAQGGGAADAVAGFNKEGRGGIVNASRSLMLAWQKEGGSGHDFAAASRREALRMREDLSRALSLR